MPVRNRKADNVLTLSQSATVEVAIVTGGSSVLAITDEAVVDHLIKTAVSIVNLTQTIEHAGIIGVDAESIILLTQSALQGGTFNRQATNVLNLTHSADSVIKAGIASSALSLTQIVDVGQPLSLAAVNSLAGEEADIDPDDLLTVDPTDPDAVTALIEGGGGLQQSVSLIKTINLQVTSYLNLNQSAGPFIEGIASSHISFTHSARTVLGAEASSKLLFTQVAVGFMSEDALSTLNLTQSVIAGLVTTEPASSTLNLRSVVSYYIVDLCGYAPGIGEGTFDVIAPSPIPPVLTRRSTTVLTFPFTSPSITLALRNPDFDNVEQFEFRRINRRSRGGTLDLFRDETWPKVKRLIYSFSGLKEDDVTDFLIFLESSIGQEIGLLDFESRQWKGIIITPSSPIQQPDQDRHSASFEFEGALV